MSISVQDGALARTIGSAGNKLVAVDFMNDSCQPCRAIHPWWESLTSRYNRLVIFCTVKCDECPTECRKYGIRSTPTFVFIVKGEEVNRIVGANKDAIISTIDKYKGAGGYSGPARTLGEPAPVSDFFASLQRQRDAKRNGEPMPAPAPVTAPAPIVAPVKEIPEETKTTMLEMGFAEDDILEAYSATRGGDMDALLTYIDKKQNTPKEPVEVKEHAPDSKEARVSNDLQRPLDDTGKLALAELVKMGYDEELSHIAINVAGSNNLPGCIDIIGKIQRGEPIPMPKHRLTQEELDQKMAQYKQLLKEKTETQKKVAPKAVANAELERRKEVLANLEAKKKHEEMKREQEKLEAEKEKIRNKVERKRVLQRIAAQKNANKPAPAAATPAQPAATAPVPAKPKSSECTLRLVFPDRSTLTGRFTPSQRLTDVNELIYTNKPNLRGRALSYEIPFPRKVLNYSHEFDTLEELELVPRAQLNVVV